jgi:nitroreductase
MEQELTVKQAAQARRSIRKYTDEPISDETIRSLVTTAGLAPSPWNLQPWRVIAVKDPETKEKLMAAAYGQPQVGASAVTFVIYTDMVGTLDEVEKTVHPGMKDREAEVAADMRKTFGAFEEADLHWWGKSQGYTFMAFLMLAAQAEGYATSGMLGFMPDKVKELFGLPDHTQIPALVAMGRPAEDGFPHHRHDFDAFAKIV